MKSKVFFFVIFTLFVQDHIFAKQRKILIIQSYHKELKWTAQCEKGISGVLKSGYIIEKFYMDTKRVQEKSFRKKADEAFSLFREMNPDLVMIGDDNGLRLLAPKLSDYQTPVVYFGINNNPRTYFKNKFKIPDNFTGVLERLPVFPWLRHLKEFVPDLKRALILFDSSPTSSAIIAQTFNGRKSSISGISVEYAKIENWINWKKTIKESVKYNVIVLATFHAVKDKNGRNVDYRDVIKWTSLNTPVPLFGHQDYTVGNRGVIGAMVVQGEKHGKLAGNQVISILERGIKPADLYPLRDHEGMFYFNRKQLKKYKLKLPLYIYRKTVFLD